MLRVVRQIVFSQYTVEHSQLGHKHRGYALAGWLLNIVEILRNISFDSSIRHWLLMLVTSWSHLWPVGDPQSWPRTIRMHINTGTITYQWAGAGWNPEPGRTILLDQCSNALPMYNVWWWHHEYRVREASEDPARTTMQYSTVQYRGPPCSTAPQCRAVSVLPVQFTPGYQAYLGDTNMEPS